MNCGRAADQSAGELVDGPTLPVLGSVSRTQGVLRSGDHLCADRVQRPRRSRGQPKSSLARRFVRAESCRSSRSIRYEEGVFGAVDCDAATGPPPAAGRSRRPGARGLRPSRRASAAYRPCSVPPSRTAARSQAPGGRHAAPSRIIVDSIAERVTARDRCSGEWRRGDGRRRRPGVVVLHPPAASVRSRATRSSSPGNRHHLVEAADGQEGGPADHCGAGHETEQGGEWEPSGRGSGAIQPSCADRVELVPGLR